MAKPVYGKYVSITPLPDMGWFTQWAMEECVAYVYEVYPKKNETFTIEQKLVKEQKKTLLITFFDVVASYLYALAMTLPLPQEGPGIVLTDQGLETPSTSFWKVLT